jgi:acyl carrier protein
MSDKLVYFIVEAKTTSELVEIVNKYKEAGGEVLGGHAVAAADPDMMVHGMTPWGPMYSREEAKKFKPYSQAMNVPESILIAEKAATLAAAELQKQKDAAVKRRAKAVDEFNTKLNGVLKYSKATRAVFATPPSKALAGRIAKELTVLVGAKVTVADVLAAKNDFDFRASLRKRFEASYTDKLAPVEVSANTSADKILTIIKRVGNVSADDVQAIDVRHFSTVHKSALVGELEKTFGIELSYPEVSSVQYADKLIELVGKKIDAKND